VASQNPQLDVAQALATALSLVFGTDVKCGAPRSPASTGNAGVKYWVQTVGGAPPQPLVNLAAAGSMFEARIRVVALGAADSADDARAKAVAARDALHGKHTSITPQAGTSTYYSCLSAGQGEPDGPWPMADDNGVYESGVELVVRWQAVT
jgi:hypothetical protein